LPEALVVHEAEAFGGVGEFSVVVEENADG
jgi:hypothetical protein